MIIYHSNNAAAFAGNHTFYTFRGTYKLATWKVSATSAAAPSGGGNSRLVNGGLVS